MPHWAVVSTCTADIANPSRGVPHPLHETPPSAILPLYESVNGEIV